MTTDNAAQETATEAQEGIKVGTLNIDLLRHGANYRGVESFELDKIKLSMLVNGRGVKLTSMWVTPEIDESGDETGQYLVYDGNRSLAALNLLKEEGVTIEPIPVVTVPSHICNDPMSLREARIKIGTSAKQLTAVESFIGYHEMMEIAISDSMANEVIDPNDAEAYAAAHKKAYKKALKDINDRFGFDNKISKVVRSAYAYWTIEQEWRDAYDDGKFGSPYDVLSVRTMVSTLEKKNGYQGGINGFVALCWQAVQDRGGASIMERDGVTARDLAIAQIKQDEVKAKIQAVATPDEAQAAEMLTEAIDSGELSSSTVEAALEVVEQSGVELSEVLQLATESAAETTPKGEEVVISDQDLQRATQRVKIEANEVATAGDTDGVDEAELSVLKEEALDNAIMIFTTCTANPDEAIKLFRKTLKAKVTPYLEDMDIQAIQKIHGIVEKARSAVATVEKKFWKRLQDSKIAEALDPVAAMLDALPPKDESF